MPDPVTHHYFSHLVLSELNDETVSIIDKPIFDRALQGPDPWSAIGFFGGNEKKHCKRSSVMHKEKTGDFFIHLTNEVKERKDPLLFSFLVGFICHYCLDKTTHPYIICKGGEYDGTKDTFCLRNGHVRIEHLIDSYYIRHYYKKEPWRFSIPKEIFKLKQYPKSFSLPLNKVFKKVYGWDNAFKLFNKSLYHQSLFYRLMQDRFGIFKFLLKFISLKNTDYTVFSYYKPEQYIGNTDYMNEGQVLWHHPYDSEIESNESFFELFNIAKEKAREIITAVYNYIYNDCEISLSALFENFNYSTGFDCDDSRNLKVPVYESVFKN